MSNKNERNICIVYQNFAFDIRLLHCGFEDNPNHAVINRRNDRYTLSYLTEGAGYYASNSKFFEIKKGDIYLLSQNTEFSQRVNPKNHYKYIYISFVGPNAQLLLEKSGLTQNYFWKKAGWHQTHPFYTLTILKSKINSAKFTIYALKTRSHL